MTRHDYERWEELQIQREHTRLLTLGADRLAILQGGLDVVHRRLDAQDSGLGWEVARLREDAAVERAHRDEAARDQALRVSAGMEALRGELAAGFSGLDTMFSSLETVLGEGLREVVALLGQMNQKLDWTDQYRSFLSFKRNAFDLVLAADPLRAIHQALAGITLRDARGTADDRIERDPELCLLLAQLVLFHAPADYAGPPVETLAEHAWLRGRMTKTRSSLAAAAGGCQLLAMFARERGDGERSAYFEEGSFVHEPGDQVGAMARLFAAQLWVDAAPSIGARVAAATVLFGRFFPTWAMEPATLARREAADEAVGAALDHLVAWDAEALEKVRARKAFWSALGPEHARGFQRAGAPPLADARGFQRAGAPPLADARSADTLFREDPPVDPELPVLDLAASVRSRLRVLALGEHTLTHALSRACRARAEELTERIGTTAFGKVIDAASAAWKAESSALDARVAAAKEAKAGLDAVWLVLPSTRARAERELAEAESTRRARQAHAQAAFAATRAGASARSKRLAELAQSLQQAPIFALPPALQRWIAEAQPTLRGVPSFTDLVALLDQVPSGWEPPADRDAQAREAVELLAWEPVVAL